MRCVFAGIALSLVVGCAEVELGAEVTKQVAVDHSTFRVQFTHNQAEATRMTAESGPTREGIMWRGYRAILLATGCQIIPGTFDGDPALMRADLFCPR